MDIEVGPPDTGHSGHPGHPNDHELYHGHPAETEEDVTRVQSPSRVVLPAVPPLLSEAFCLLNCFTPGLGTLCASISCCCARTRGMSKVEVVASIFVGLFIALLQLLLTPLLLLGWIWSCFWGILITAQSDAYYKPRNQQDQRPRGIIPSLQHNQTVHPEAPPPYTFYDDYFQRGRTPPPPYSPPEHPAVVVQPGVRDPAPCPQVAPPDRPNSIATNAPPPVTSQVRSVDVSWATVHGARNNNQLPDVS